MPVAQGGRFSYLAKYINDTVQVPLVGRKKEGKDEPVEGEVEFSRRETLSCCRGLVNLPARKGFWETDLGEGSSSSENWQ